MESIGKLEGLKDEQADDALGPGRTGLERRCNDDVVGPRNDVVPARRVEVMAPVDAGALREGSRHTSESESPRCVRRTPPRAGRVARAGWSGKRLARAPNMAGRHDVPSAT